ncbi:MAG: hypothetical protein IK065_05515 [Neisseriaceae bacterium]|nr:hypothetical protein [Neisseriaceae bacterium]
MGFPVYQNAVCVNPLYFNNFLFSTVGRLVGQEAHPTAFLFQKLGFAGVSCQQFIKHFRQSLY